MKKFKKIFGCLLTSALSLVLAITTLGGKNASADEAPVTVINPAYVESQFSKNEGATVTAATYMPKYIKDRGFWKGPSDGVKITFTKESGSVIYNKVLNYEQVKNLVSFTALPSESVFNNSKVEFNNLYITLYEVDTTINKATGNEVIFIYNSAYKNVTAMKGADEGGEVSSYFSAYAKYVVEEEENKKTIEQKPYCLVGDSVYQNDTDDETTSVIADESIAGVPRYNSAGAGGSTTVQASMRDTRAPLTFGYSQTGEGENLVCLGTADNVKYGSNIRVFNEYRNPNEKYSPEDVEKNGYVDDVDENGISKIFPGFNPNSKFKVKFHIDEFYSGSNEASFLIYSIGGESLQNRLSASSNYLGVENLAYPIPAPTFHNEDGTLVDASSFDYEVEVTGPELPVPEGSPEGTLPQKFSVKGAKLDSFTPTVKGEYKISYLSVVSGKTYGYDIFINVVDKISDISLDNVSVASEFNKVYGSLYRVYAEAVSKIYTDGSTSPLSIELYRKTGETTLEFIQYLKVGDSLNLKTLNLGFGEYIVRYYTKDALNREKQIDIVLNQVKENRLIVAMLNGVDGATENFYFGTGTDVFISKEDVTVYDGIKGRDFVSPTIEIYYESETTPYVVGNDGISFNEYFKTIANAKWGTYRIDYKYSYDDGDLTFNKTLSKSLEVLDAIAPKIYSTTDRYIFGAKLDAEKSTSEGAKYFTAKKGTTLEFDAIVATDGTGDKYSLTDRISLKIVKPNGEAIDVPSIESGLANPFNSVDYSYLVDTNGQYVFRFDVYDEMIAGSVNMTSSLVYIVDVADDFYSVTVNETYDVETNLDTFTLSSVTVSDFNGNLVNADVTVTAKNSKGEVVWTGAPGDVKKFELTGAYDIIVTAKVSGKIVAEEVYKVTIADTTKPQIVIKDNLVAKGVVGKELTLPTVSVVDENGFASVTVEVKFGQSAINVYQNSFTPIESGNYTVTYTAIDLAGNESVYSYDIVIIDNYEGSIAKFFNNYGLFVAIPLVLVAGALVVILIMKKGKKSASSNDEEEIEVTEVAEESQSNEE